MNSVAMLIHDDFLQKIPVNTEDKLFTVVAMEVLIKS
jgi:hypothetical protein